MKEFLSSLKITKETLKRALRTFIQAAVAYLVANIVFVDFADKSILKSALVGVITSAVAAGIAAVMNIEKKETQEMGAGSSTISYDAWVAKYLGKQTDYDGVSGVQCVDLVKTYLDSVFGIKAGAWGNAIDYWLSFSSHKELTANFTKIANTAELVPQKGDIVVWSGAVSTSNNYGHIAVATGEGNTSKFYTYDQNWNGKEMKKVEHSYTAVYGVLRPKNQSQILSSAPTVKNGTYTLKEVIGVYRKNSNGTFTKKKVSELTADGKKNATSAKLTAAANLKKGTKVTISSTLTDKDSNLWAAIPSGYILIWHHSAGVLRIS